MMSMKLCPFDSIVELVQNGDGLSNDYEVACMLFTNIKNSLYIHRGLINGDIQAAFIKPSMIIDILQVIIAANRALRSKRHDRMVTKSIYTEIIYNLSPTRKISDALNKFGFTGTDQNGLAVLFQSTESNQISDLKALVDGDVTDIKHLRNYSDENAIRNFYKIETDDPSTNGLLNCVLGRMACKEFSVI